MTSIDYHLVCRPLFNAPADESGDTGVITAYGGDCFLGLIDALGHGKEAAKCAARARAYLEEHVREDLVAIMEGLHQCLRGTRGAVAALCRLNVERGEIAHTAIGDITVKIMGPRAFTFVSRDGVLGYMAPSPREQRRQLYAGDILLMHSDGIREHFDPLECPGLFTGTAAVIGRELLERFGKKDDDASCIIMRYLA